MEPAKLYSARVGSAGWSRSYRKFIKDCCAYRPSDLVPAIARVSASLGDTPHLDFSTSYRSLWGLAVAARESLLYGTEVPGKIVTDPRIERLMYRLFDAEALPDLRPGDSGFMLSALTPVLYEQFPWQESIFEEVARTYALMVDGLNHVATDVISEASLTELLDGVPLVQAVGATFVLHCLAYEHGGVYDPGRLDDEDFQEVFARYPRSAIEASARRLTATRAEFKADFDQHSHGNRKLAKYDYNPLVRTPFVALEGGLTVAPAPRLIMRTVTPSGLYYPGFDRFGPGFGNDLGRLFENYVGRNLDLIDGAEVHPEVEYGSKKQRKKSIDWFVVMPGLVLLIECKLKRLGLPARAGDAPLHTDLKGAVEKAYEQLTHSLDALAAKLPEFGHIPTDRPMLAMIVSAEPIYVGDAYLVDQHGASLSSGPFRDVPVATVSARQLEMLVTRGAGVEQQLLELIQKHVPGTAFALSGIAAHEGKINSILESAWAAYDFPSVSHSGESSM